LCRLYCACAASLGGGISISWIVLCALRTHGRVLRAVACRDSVAHARERRKGRGSALV
jgi:hypothetical protein